VIESVFTIGGVLVVIAIILGIVVLKATPKTSYLGYAPGAVFFAAGLVLLLLASIIEKTVILGAGLGGWGIACLFAAVFSLIFTSTAESFAQKA